MKDKAFARGVNRDDIVKGASELGISLEDHIANCIAAMQSNAEALGLQGIATTRLIDPRVLHSARQCRTPSVTCNL